MKFESMLRLLVLLLLMIVSLISGMYRNRARKDTDQIKRREEDWGVLLLQVVSGVSLFTVLLLDIFMPGWMTWSKISLPNWLRIAGVAVALLCVIWLWWVFRIIGTNISETIQTKESQNLVTSGPYRLVRHPLYAGSLMFLLALGLVFEDWLILIFALVGILVFRLLVIPEEEKELLESFGEDYESYQSRTGALVPWIR